MQCLVGVMTTNLVVADAPSWVLCGVVQWLMPAWISTIVLDRAVSDEQDAVGVRVVRPPRVPYGLWFWHSPETLTFCRPKSPQDRRGHVSWPGAATWHPRDVGALQRANAIVARRPYRVAAGSACRTRSGRPRTVKRP